MHSHSIFAGITLLGGMFFFTASDDESKKKQGPETSRAVVEVKAQSPQIEKSVDDASPTRDKDRTEDENAIREAGLTFKTAYQNGDAPAVAALFTTDAEYVDEGGNVFDGREEIETSLVEFFEEHQQCSLEMSTDSIRFISPGVAIEDGTTEMTCAEASTSVASCYSTLHVKSEGKWLIASVRNHAPRDRHEHQAHLQQLDWLIGHWVDENEDAVVNFSCEPMDNGNFLVRNFTIQIAGMDAMTGTQRIGWDPLSRKLRTWIFDSEGSFGEGSWSQRIDEDGAESWLLKTSGVMADGQTASSTSIYTAVNDHTMTWQSVDHEIGGEQQPDSEIMTIVRSSPAPGQKIADDSK